MTEGAEPDAGFRVIQLSGLPLIEPGAALADLLIAAVARTADGLRPGDIVVVAQKIVSKAEGRTVRLDTTAAGAEAEELARRTGRPAALAQLILNESQEVMRATPAVVIVRHRLGHVLANAGIDASNVAGGDADTVLLWPEDPDASAAALAASLTAAAGGAVGVVIADSMGRAWRIGTVGTAIGVAGLGAVDDRRGEPDLFGRPLRATIVATADALAAAAVLAMGEAAEGTPAALIRGLALPPAPGGAKPLLRPLAEDLFQ